MDKKQKSNWKEYIKELSDFPPLIQKWEYDFIQATSDFIPKNKIKKVLEVGCSNGRWLRWFNKEYNCEVYGVDNNPAGFKKEDVIDFTLGDAKNLPYKDETFDVVFSMGLIEHFLKEEKYQILKEQSRVLKNGGFLVCQAPLLSFSLNFLYMKYAYDYKRGIKHYRTTEREIKNYLNNLGLKIVLSKFTGCFLESNFLKKIIKIKPLNNLFATEILIISKKQNT